MAAARSMPGDQRQDLGLPRRHLRLLRCPTVVMFPPVNSVNACIFRNAWSLARSGSLPFAPSVSPCHAVNVR